MMQKTIQLNEKEATLRQLLLDVSHFIGSLNGYERPQLRFTGGWVRDKLLGVESNDIDISIDSMTGFTFGTLMNQYLERPEVHAKYPGSNVRKLAKIQANPENSKHLETVTTKIFKFDVDLVNLRKETYADVSRTPQMEFGTPVDDALRRDATINALFYNLDKSEVEDLTKRGLEDMKQQVIKTPLDPYQTFKDDPLRVLRAIRFASRLGWRIDEGDERAMSDSGIHEKFMEKITRERVYIELTKMLKGPSPHQALRLIDRLNLYLIIFTTFDSQLDQSVKTLHWKNGYEQLQEIMNATLEAEIAKDSRGSSKTIIKSILFKDTDNPNQDNFHAWLLCAFVPWARVTAPPSDDPEAKAPPQPAAIAAREGIKAENKTIKIVGNAVAHLDEIIRTKDALANPISTTSPWKRKRDDTTRSEQGMAIRRWGPHWRSSVLYALLTQIMEDFEHGNDTSSQRILDGYASWLSSIQDMDLLEVHELKPLVTGKKLAKALCIGTGPWTSRAIEMVIEWQLANPDEKNPDEAVSNVVSRKKELGLG